MWTGDLVKDMVEYLPNLLGDYALLTFITNYWLTSMTSQESKMNVNVFGV